MLLYPYGSTPLDGASSTEELPDRFIAVTVFCFFRIFRSFTLGHGNVHIDLVLGGVLLY